MRARVSTTVDAALLADARSLMPGIRDHALFDQALAALVAANRAAELDASYTAYDDHPVDAPDQWGDVGAWRHTVGRQ